MKKLLANYSVFPSGLLINHLSVVGDDGRLLEVAPVTEELADTLYVPETLCFIPQDEIARVTRLFEQSVSRADFVTRFCRLFHPDALADATVAVLALDFNDCHIARLL